MRPSEVCPFSLRPWPLGRVMTQLKHHNKVCVVVLYAHWSYHFVTSCILNKKYSELNLNCIFFFFAKIELVTSLGKVEIFEEKLKCPTTRPENFVPKSTTSKMQMMCPLYEERRREMSFGSM